MTVARRVLLKFALGGGAWMVAGCQASIMDQPPAWPVPELVFVEGSGGTVELAGTLPPGVRPGGTFELDPSSAPLPGGMTLSPGGTLALGTATAGTVSGVIFLYAEPA